MKSLMVVPYISNKTLPRYFQYLIEGYTYQPELIRYYPNDLKKPVYQNYLDYKVIESFAYHQPTDYIIYHACDVYLMPIDLQNIIDELEDTPDAFANGIYPITQFRNATMNEPPVIPTRIGVWKSNIFQECLTEFREKSQKASQGLIVDEIYRMGEIAVQKGYRCLISKSARPQFAFGTEVKVPGLSW